MAEATATKTCRRCGGAKPLGEFRKRTRSKDGLTVWCKPCSSEYHKAHYAANRERLLAESAAHYAANKAKRNAQQLAWYYANKDRQAAYQREVARVNPHAGAQRMAKWRAENPERTREAKLRRRALEVGTSVGPIDYAALWTGVCGICDEPMDELLRAPDLMRKSIDHIIPLAKGGTHTQGNCQWAHLLCNARKGHRTT